MSHTPGPWKPQDRDKYERGIAIVAVIPEVPQGGTPTRGMVAWVGQAGANFGSSYTQKANAALIAAAPDLLAALKDYHAATDAILEVGSDGQIPANIALTYVGAKERAFKAIAKAEGR